MSRGGVQRRTQAMSDSVIDRQGYRANVGIILVDDRGRVFWGRRVGQRGWQFPQGGIEPTETPEEAMFRELFEETGLGPDDVEVLGCTRDWLRYELPKRYIRRNASPPCIGQKQIWFLVRLKTDECCVQLDACDRPEFEEWRWVSYWLPVREVIFFKRRVYLRALRELAPVMREHCDPCAHRQRTGSGRRQRRHR